MLALKEMGHISSIYVFETVSKESMDGSISPRTVEALYKCEVFKNVPPDVLPAVVNNSRRKHYEAGERVVVAGERSESMFIVCSGRLVCEVNGIEVCTSDHPFPIHHVHTLTWTSVPSLSAVFLVAGKVSGRSPCSPIAHGT